MDRIAEMTAFVAVAEARSFSVAASKLGLSAPTITRSVASLERRIGAPLLARSTRSVRLTDAGLQFLADARRILGDLDDAEQGLSAGPDAARGRLVITAPVLFGEMRVMPVVHEFLKHHPQVKANVLMLDRVVNIVEEGIDVAVRIGHFDDPAMHATPVGRVRRMLVASPAYLRQYGEPERPDALTEHRIAMSVSANASREWRLDDGSHAESVRVDPVLTVSTLRAAIDTARQGLAITRALSYQVAEAVKSGELQVVLREFEPAPLPVSLVYLASRRPSAKLMAFVELAAARLGAALADAP